MGILAGTTFSDHAQVILVLEDQRRPAGTQLRIPEVVVTDARLCGESEELWMEAQRQDLDSAEQCAKGLRGISCFLHEKAKCRLEELRERERRLRRGLCALQRIQERSPQDSEVEEQISRARQEIREVEEGRHAFFFHSQASQWT